MLCLIGLICLQVIQNTPFQVPIVDGAVTRFPGVPGQVFLAHNYAAGRHFFDLSYGSEIEYGGEKYFVNEVVFMQAVEPQNPYGDLIDLESGIRHTSSEVRERVYMDGLTLQTCVLRDDDPYWGRVFVRAKKENSD